MSQAIIGKSVSRVDGVDKVTGQAKYVGDIRIPGMVEGKFLRSPYAHARILSINTEEAENVPGVIAVLTARDLSNINPYLGRGQRKDQPILAIDRVVFAGQVVAAVAALDEFAAEEALRKVHVEYQELPAVTGIQEAIAKDAPQLYSFAPNNICFQDRLEKGDVERGFAEADEIFEDTFEFPMVYHYSMEPHTTIAQVDADGITVWSSNTHPFGIRKEIAEVFDCPLSEVRVIVPFVGGAYGSKSGSKIEPLVVALARKAQRPVKVSLNIAEAMMTVRRHSAICRVKTGVTKDGNLVAKEAEIFLNTGAYAETGPVVTRRTLTRILGPYRIPNISVTGYCVYTNTVSAASFRSIGGPQTAWATESQMDIVADKLSIDPVQFRRKNLLRRGEELKPKGKPLDADLFEGLQKVVQGLGWDGRRSKKGGGRGVAFGVTDPGAPLASTTTVHVLSDGSIVLLTGTVEVGQGARTVMSQIVAEELSVPLARVAARSIDTAYTPFDRSTGSSRSTTVMGKAIQMAAQDARKQLVELAADYFEAPAETITLNDGEAMAGRKKIDYGELIHRHFAMQGGEIIGRGYAHSGMAPSPGDPLFWEIGIGGVEVELDQETGEIAIKKYVTAADVGKALHPLQCEGQDEGAAMMGLGHTLYESIVYEDGQILNASLVDYKVPTFRDLPEQFESILIENEDGPGPYGAKGMGEGAIIPVAPAIANAIASITGVRIRELPLTPEKIWRALKKGKGNNGQA
jgi:CO/xanthine dehydrogenase Mo-binding subunit